uniref:Uncharacterized protein n=1 Tax=Arundo donax TaxID=35708 RepID=A0A0A9D5G6_ARUDO
MLNRLVYILIYIRGIKLQLGIYKVLDNISNETCLTKTEDIHEPNKLTSLISADMPCAIELFYLTQTQLINKHSGKKLYS